MRLYESDHPYYATEGCYYVSGTLGHPGRGGHDGITCHSDYDSWTDFKAGNERPFSAEQLVTRRQYGITETTAEERARQEKAFGKLSFYTADDDYNLLYRWDWKIPDPSDYEGEGEEMPPEQLKLFYMLQRKARPHSVTVNVDRADEPEIREWLKKKWYHLQRLWVPFAPEVNVEASDEERAEVAMLHYGAEAQGAQP